MPLDLALFSPEEWQTYQELGRRFDPEDAIAQADSTLLALSGATRALMAHGFLLEDQTTLRTARHQLDEVHHGGGRVRGARRKHQSDLSQGALSP